MIGFNTKSLALVLALAPAQTLAQCLNSNSFTYFFDGKERSCKNIRINDDRRALLCQVAEVNVACPQTCGSCCEDSTEYSFERNNGSGGDCAFLAAKEKRITKFCPIIDKSYGEGDLRGTVRDGCPVTCGFCFTGDKKVTVAPSAAPTQAAPPTKSPVTSAPTVSKAPTKMPSKSPSVGPTEVPTRPPSPMPSPFPTLRPTNEPSDSPSEAPSDEPSRSPSSMPSDQPSEKPSLFPSDSPSEAPSDEPSKSPSSMPSDQPSTSPSSMPSDQPSSSPSDDPSVEPSGMPSDTPTRNPSSEPSITPTNNPTRSVKPSATPTGAPIGTPTKAPVGTPTKAPTKAPTMAPVVSCVDDPTYTFVLSWDQSVKTCDWISKNDSKLTIRQGEYCDTTQGARLISEACCAACSKTLE